MTAWRECLWQQLTGDAIVGDWTGTGFEKVPAQLISVVLSALGLGGLFWFTRRRA